MVNDIREWCFASVYLVLIVYFWGMSTLVKLPVILPVFLMSKFTDKSEVLGKQVYWGKWAYNMFISDDQSANTVLGGDRDITVSSRVGFNAKEGNPIALRMEIVIDYLFYVFAKQENHCRVSLEIDEKHNKDWGG
jgi:hypothetical protein